MVVLAGAALCLVMVGVGIASIRGMKRQAQRSRAIERIGRANGFTYSPEGGADHVRVPFELFRQGDGRGAENLLQGRAPDGAIVRVFDFFFYDEQEREGLDLGGLGGLAGDDEVTQVPARTYHWFTCCVTELDAIYPPTTIERKGALLRALSAVGVRSMEFESEAFNRMFLVSSEDSRFLQHFMTPQVMDLLLDTEGKVRFELRGRWLLAALDRKDVTPDLFLSLVGLTTELRARIPNVVRGMTTQLPDNPADPLPNLRLPDETRPR
jgi:hypothetical protein